MNWAEICVIYVIGALFWSFIMGLQGERFDYGFIITVMIWPISVIRFFGICIRALFK